MELKYNPEDDVVSKSDDGRIFVLSNKLDFPVLRAAEGPWSKDVVAADELAEDWTPVEDEEEATYWLNDAAKDLIESKGLTE